MAARRGKRSAAASADVAAPPTATTAITNHSYGPSNALGMTPAQFSCILCISITMTHCVDIYKSVHKGSENSTYCTRHFAYAPEPDDASSNTLPCTESDMGILTIRYQTALLRIMLHFIIMLLCWTNESLLRSWNFASAISPLGTSIAGIITQRDYLKAPEKFSLAALLILSLASNREGRMPRLAVKMKEGLFNITLFSLTTFMSYTIANHLILGVGEYTTFTAEDITDGGRALWFMTIFVEYTAFMFTATFALFYFDEMRKRVSSCFNKIKTRMRKILHMYCVCLLLSIFAMDLLKSH